VVTIRFKTGSTWFGFKNRFTNRLATKSGLIFSSVAMTEASKEQFKRVRCPPTTTTTH